MSLFRRGGVPPSRIILGSFAVLIAAGTLLLMLPVATKAGGSAGFMDALFTAVSATCVTGLIVQDTFSYWSMFGQAVILVLIQIGGMGVVTMAIFIAMFTGKTIGFSPRMLMREAISAPKIGGIVKMTGFIVKATLCIEGAGALLLSLRFCPELGAEGIWYAVFHSVSAFCNAGFDLMGRNAPYSSLTDYSGDPIINLTVMALIIIGGIGFFTWSDIVQSKGHFRRLALRSKLIFTITSILIVVPFLVFFFSDFRELSAGQRILPALFQSVTARTAGFNTVDLNAFTSTSKLVLVLLMLVGGAPGSTAGGFKVTTLATLLLNIRAVFGGKGSIHCFKRRLPAGTINSACAICSLYVVLFIGAAAIICAVDHTPLEATVFETASAIGTVGLSLGITGDFSTPSRFVLIFLMYFGRVGGLTMMYAIAARRIPSPAEMPEEKISIG